MQFYKNERDYLSNIVRAEKGYDDKHLYLRFLTGSRHNIEICVERVDKLVKLSSEKFLYSIMINKLIDEEEFINDIRKMVAVMAWVTLAKEDFVYPLGQLLHEHIQKHGRVLKDDLQTYIAELILVFNAFGEAESGEVLNSSGLSQLVTICENFASIEFRQYIQ